MNEELSLSEQKAEKWREIPGYEGLYEASNLGRIRSVSGKITSSARFKRRVWKPRIMKQKITKSAKGRLDARVCLWKLGKKYTHLVSRLVAMTWCDGYAKELTVNHINGNALDNRSENLEWCTLSENIRIGFETGLFNSFMIPVTLIDCETNQEKVFRSCSFASTYLGRSSKYVSKCLKVGRMATSSEGKKYKICVSS